MNKKRKLCVEFQFFMDDGYGMDITWKNAELQHPAFHPKDSRGMKVSAHAAPCPIYINADVIKQKEDSSSLYWAMQHSDSSGGIYFDEHCVSSLCEGMKADQYWTVIYSYFGLLHGVCLTGIRYSVDGRLDEALQCDFLTHSCIIQLITLCDFLDDRATLELLLSNLCKELSVSIRHRNAYFHAFSRLNVEEWPQLFKIGNELASGYSFCAPDALACRVITTLLNSDQTGNGVALLTALRIAEARIYKPALFGSYDALQEQHLQNCFLDLTPQLWCRLLECKRDEMLDQLVSESYDCLIQEHTEVKLQSSMMFCMMLLRYFWGCVFPDLPKHITECLFLSGSIIPMCFIRFSRDGVSHSVSKYFHESDLDVYVIGAEPESVVKYVTLYLKRTHPHTWMKKRTELKYASGVACKIVTLVLPRHPLFSMRSYNVQLISYGGGSTPITPYQIATHHHFDPVRTFYDPVRDMIVAAPSALLSWATCCIFGLRDKRNDSGDGVSALMKYLSRRFSIVIDQESFFCGYTETIALARTLDKVRQLLPPNILDSLQDGSRDAAGQLHALLQLHHSGFLRTMSNTGSERYDFFKAMSVTDSSNTEIFGECYNNFCANYQRLLDDNVFTY